MDVAIKPAVECTELRADQDERFGDLSSLQESVQIIYHAGKQQHSYVSARNQDMLQTGPGGLFIQLAGTKTPCVRDEYDRPLLVLLISTQLINRFNKNQQKVIMETQK